MISSVSERYIFAYLAPKLGIFFNALTAFSFRFYSFFWVFFLLSAALQGQYAKTTTLTLQEVILEATKTGTQQAKTTMPITVLNVGAEQPFRQQLSLQEYLTSVPGLFAANATNQAQDLRVSIRGFGARAAFGIRGVKIVVDGIPETTPDGQGQIDNIPLGLVDRIEVLRGPASSIYGNASGGVLYIKTLDSLEDKNAVIRYSNSSLLNSNLNLIGQFKSEKTTAMVYQNIARVNGYRDFSQAQQAVFNASVKHRISETNRLVWRVNYTSSPYAHDPGGLTLEEVNQNRRQARQRNLDYDAHERIRHFKTSFQYYSKQGLQTEWNNFVYYSYRDFQGQLPFQDGGVVSLYRNYAGFGSNVTIKSIPEISLSDNTFQLGVEMNVQSDRRNRFENLLGQPGVQSFSQLESFVNIGLYAFDEVQFNKWLLRFAARMDKHYIGAKSNIVENTQYTVLSPSFGLNYAVDDQLQVYGTLSSSFEGPTLSELSSNPYAASGLNDKLEPIHSKNLEVGLKWMAPGVVLDFTAFWIRSDNEIIPFELADTPGRIYYQNAGATSRAGFEFYWQQYWRQWLWTFSLTDARYRFKDYVVENRDYTGNFLPGIPQSQWNAALQYTTDYDLLLRMQIQYVDRMYADDANELVISPYELVHLNASKKFALDAVSAISVFGGVENLFNELYYDNIRINAFGKRYYEPGPTRVFYVGASLEF